MVKEHGTSPTLQCNNCPNKEFCGGFTRITHHICEVCTAETDAFCDLKQKLLEERASGEECR